MLDRAISRTNLLMLSAGGMIGSSWLFSPFISAKMAGPYALYAWIIASFFMLLIALPLCELGTIFPMAGGIVNYPSITHGAGMGFLFGWITWLAYVVCAPIEVQAVMQYGSYYFPLLVDTTQPGFHLSAYGYGCSFLVLLAVMVLNAFGVRVFARCNRFISIFKFIVPLIAILGFFLVSPVWSYHIHLGIPKMKDWEAIFSCLSFGGIAFAFTGFQNGLLMAGEVKDPNRSIPLSILGAVLIGFLVYFSLQWSFLIAVPDYAIQSGWQQLHFSGQSSPLVGLSMLLGLGWIASLLLIDASVSPLGTSLVYTGVTARILYAMGKNKEIPSIFSRLNRYKVPLFAMVINLAVGMFSFLPFSGWQDMVVFLSSCSILSYLIGPICLLAIIEHHPKLRQGFYLPMAKLVCFFSFYAAMLMLVWCGFTILWKLSLAIGIGVVLYTSVHKESLPLKNLVWILLLMSSLLITSYYNQMYNFYYAILMMLPIAYLLLRYSQWIAFHRNIEILPEHIRIHLANNSGKIGEI